MNNIKHISPRVCSKSTLGLALIASGLLAVPTYGQFVFNATVNVTAGPQPGGAAVGDLDGDGDIDLATGIRFSDRVVILVNDGIGGFTIAQYIDYPQHSEPEDVLAGDLDGDGDLDLAVILGDLAQIRVAINEGNLVFTHGSITSIGGGGRDMDMKDMDGDGDLDIAVANRGSNTATVLENNGDATFTTTTLPSAGEPRSATFGDFDGDLDLDLAVTNNDAFNVRLFRNDAGVFTPWHVLSTAPNQAEGVTAADLDNDGDIDIATGAEDDNTGVNNAVIFLNDGGGASFTGPLAFNTSGVGTSGVVARDLDCDGLLDLALSNQDSNNVSLLKNMGSGSFGPASLLSIGINPEALSFADFDGDGLTDLVTGNRDSSNMSVMITRTCTPGAITAPDGFIAFRGFLASGTLADVLESDDNDLCYEPGIVLNPTEAPVTLDFSGTLPNDSPSTLDVTIESSANTVGLEITFSFWNFNTNMWDVVGTAGQSLNTDTVRTFAGNPADHVEPGTGEVMTRYEVRVVSFIFIFPWTDCVDHVFWTTT